MRPPVAPAPRLAPALRAIPFLKGAHDPDAILLTQRQREELARIGMRLRLPARMTIYREEAAADWVFAIADGAVKCYRNLPSGKRVVGAFLFARDLFGLAQSGRYVNCAQTITPSTIYRLPLDDLMVLVKHDADLQFQFLTKITHELREAQRRAVLVARRDAAGRLAMFIALMAAHAGRMNRHAAEVPLPMTRSDIADFLGLSQESVRRAAAELERRGLVRFEHRHLARVADSARFARFVAAV